jgi:hypothetical protein
LNMNNERINCYLKTIGFSWETWNETNISDIKVLMDCDNRRSRFDTFDVPERMGSLYEILDYE